MLRKSYRSHDESKSGRSSTFLSFLNDINSGFMLTNLGNFNLKDDQVKAAEKLKEITPDRQEIIRSIFSNDYYFFDTNGLMAQGFIPLKQQEKNWYSNDLFYFFVNPQNCPGLPAISKEFKDCALLFAANPFNFTNVHRGYDVFEYSGHPITMLESMSKEKEEEEFKAMKVDFKQNPMSNAAWDLGKIVYANNLYVKMQIYIVNPHTKDITPIEKVVPIEILQLRPFLMYFCLDVETRKKFNEWKRTFDHRKWEKNVKLEKLEHDDQTDLEQLAVESPGNQSVTNEEEKEETRSITTDEEGTLEENEYEWVEQMDHDKSLYNYNLPGGRSKLKPMSIAEAKTKLSRYHVREATRGAVQMVTELARPENIVLEDVGGEKETLCGYEEQHNRLRSLFSDDYYSSVAEDLIAWFTKRPPCREQKPVNVILHGPPGTGKTTMANNIAIELDCGFVKMTPASLAGKYVNEGQHKVQFAFNVIKTANKLLKKTPEDRAINCVSFLDEGEEVLADRSKSGMNSDVVSVFLTNLEKDEDRFAFITATNQIDRIDDAIKSRCDVIEVPAPSLEDIKKIIQHKLSRIADDDLLEIAEFCMNHYQSNQYPYKFDPMGGRDIVSALDKVVTRKASHFIKEHNRMMRFFRERNVATHFSNEQDLIDRTLDAFLPTKDDIMTGIVDKLFERYLIKKKKEKKLDTNKLGIAMDMYYKSNSGQTIIEKWREYGRYKEVKNNVEEEDEEFEYVAADEEDADDEDADDEDAVDEDSD